MTRARAITRTCANGVCLLFFIACAVALAGCTTGANIEDSIGVGPEDNAILRVEAHIDPAWSESSADYCRTEFPASVDVSTLTPEQIEAATDC